MFPSVKNFLARVFDSNALGDLSYTRNPVKEEDEMQSSTKEWFKEKFPEFLGIFSQYCEAAHLLKEVIKNSLCKQGVEEFYDTRGKFEVNGAAKAFDMIQYILCAEELRVQNGITDNLKSNGKSKENLNEKLVFLSDEIYVQHFLCRFALYAIGSAGQCFDHKLSEKDKQKLFDLFLKLRDKKGNATELALELVGLLKNYIKPENLKLLKEKGFLEKVDARFAKVLGLENKIVDNTELINLGEGNINN